MSSFSFVVFCPLDATGSIVDSRFLGIEIGAHRPSSLRTPGHPVTIRPLRITDYKFTDAPKAATPAFHAPENTRQVSPKNSSVYHPERLGGGGEGSGEGEEKGDDVYGNL